MKKELTVWGALKHQNIVELYGYTTDHGPLLSMVSKVRIYDDPTENIMTKF